MNRWRSPGRGLACKCTASRPTSRHSSRSTSYLRTPCPPTRTFGAHHEGMVTYLILDGQRRVDVLSVLWLG
jgi:hypothetical protein